MQSIAQSLEDFTARHSNFEKKRNYISLSHILLPAEEILNQWFNGFEDSKHIRLRCYKGYQMERDLLRRLKSVFGDRIKTDIEIVAFVDYIKGHPDFTFDDYPGDCKSVPLDEYLPQPGRLPRKVYWQMQAYLKYSGKPKGVVIYESRETGKINEYWVVENKAIQEEIEQKLKLVVSEIPQLA